MSTKDPQRSSAFWKLRSHVGGTHDEAYDGKLRIQKVSLDRGGYDRSQVYFGRGEPLFFVTDAETEGSRVAFHIRADDAAHVRSKIGVAYPGALRRARRQTQAARGEFKTIREALAAHGAASPSVRRARPPRATYFDVTRTQDGGAVVLARHPMAKQVLWSWGSDRSSDERSFYGTEVNPREPVHVDFQQWRWTLAPSAVDLLCRDIKRTIDDPAYNYKRVEKTAARELVHFLTRKTGRR